MYILISIVMFSVSMAFSSFIGATIVMCLFAGIGMMRKLENAGLLLRTNYKKYILPVLFWIIIFISITLLIAFKTKYLIFWIIGSAFGFLLSIKKSFNRENLIPSIKEFCRNNKDIIISNDAYADMLYNIFKGN